jgi:hypothetical protein
MTNSHEQAERAGFDSLSKDQQEAIRRFQADGERARRIRENGEALVSYLRAMVRIADASGYQSVADGLLAVEAEDLLAKIEGSR